MKKFGFLFIFWVSSISSAARLEKDLRQEYRSCRDNIPRVMRCSHDGKRIWTRFTPRMQWNPVITETDVGTKLQIQYLYQEIDSKFEIFGATIIKGYEPYPNITMDCEDGKIGAMEFQLNETEKMPTVCEPAD